MWSSAAVGWLTEAGFRALESQSDLLLTTPNPVRCNPGTAFARSPCRFDVSLLHITTFGRSPVHGARLR